MKRIFLTAVLIFFIATKVIVAQKIITLKDCYDLASTASALSKEAAGYADISRLKDENLSKSWLPVLDANGSFVYNSSVIDLSGVLGALPVPGLAGMIKPLPHEQYKVTLDVSQVIYDGGAVKSARELEKADLSVNSKQTEADLYKLRSQINGYFFNILLLTRQKELLHTYLDIITKRLSSIRSGIANGVVLKTDADVLASEEIKIRQQLTENNIRRNALMKILSSLTASPIDSSTVFMMPEVTGALISEINRPELQLFDLRKNQLSAGEGMLDARRRPKAVGFATFGYGNPPGSNFFKNEFAPYYMVGGSIKWNIFDWNKTKNEREIITMQQTVLENRKNDLTDNIKRQLDVKESEINSLETLSGTDAELIALRKRITASAESQYQNGTITATEYLNELNAERQAVINSELHKISLTLSKVEFLNISGGDIR